MERAQDDKPRLNTSAQDSIVALEALLEINSSVLNASGCKNSHSSSSDFGEVETSNEQSSDMTNQCSNANANGLSLVINQPATAELATFNNRNHLPYTPTLIGPSPPFYPFIYSNTQSPCLTLPHSLGSKTIKASSSSRSNSESEKLNVSCPEMVMSNPENAPVRTEEIEAALRSKPQRGRRRDNLSVVERQELTRTRNRAHARSTRNRKKARYEELLEKEKKYDLLTQISNLSYNRRSRLIEFMRLRSDGLSINSKPSHQKDIFQLINPEVFEYFTLPPMVPNANITTRKTGLETLKYHDESLIESIPKWLDGKKATYEFKIKDEFDGIAILSDTGHAMYDIIISIVTDSSSDNAKGKETETTMLSGFINIHFEAGSSMINTIRESLLNPSMTTSSITTKNTASSNAISYLMIPIKQNEHQSFPNVISWHNIGGESASSSPSTNMLTDTGGDSSKQATEIGRDDIDRSFKIYENGDNNKRANIQVDDIDNGCKQAKV